MKECYLYINKQRIKNLRQLAEYFKDEDVLAAYKNGRLMDFLKESYPPKVETLEKINPNLDGEALLKAIIDALNLDKSAVDTARAKTQSEERKKLEKQAEEFFRREEYDSAVQRSEHIEWKFPSQSAVAQRILGLCHLAGNGTYKDVDKALKLLKIAADKNDIHAQVALACVYLLGLDIALPNNTTMKSYQNEKKAGEYFLSPDVQKNKDIVSHVVDYYEKVMGKKYGEVFYTVYTVACYFKQQNSDELFEYYLIEAAKRHHPDAQYTLGLKHLGRKNKIRATYWFQHAADQGHTSAREMLSAMKTRPWADLALRVASEILMLWGPRWMFPLKR